MVRAEYWMAGLQRKCNDALILIPIDLPGLQGIAHKKPSDVPVEPYREGRSLTPLLFGKRRTIRESIVLESDRNRPPCSTTQVPVECTWFGAGRRVTWCCHGPSTMLAMVPAMDVFSPVSLVAGAPLPNIHSCGCARQAQDITVGPMTVSGALTFRCASSRPAERLNLARARGFARHSSRRNPAAPVAHRVIDAGIDRRCPANARQRAWRIVGANMQTARKSRKKSKLPL